MTEPIDQTEQQAQDGRNDEAINGPNPPKWIHFFYYQELKDQLAKERELIKELVEYLEQYKFIFDEGGQTRKEIESLIQKAKDKTHE